ncbi:MAG: histidine kinase N-terminal 7TM domain-containing protein [Coriobacteriia bacterium]|nr:histidine kinase N-terminal 7TM domain-containing protein [Coriobacteriia bacterium]
MKTPLREKIGFLAGLVLLGLCCLGGSFTLPASNALELFAIGAAPLACIAAIAGWAVTLERRITHRTIRLHLVTIALLMALWIILRTFRHHFTHYDDPASFMAWYLYYVPMLLIPLLCVLSAGCIGRPEGAPVRPISKVLAAVTVCMIALVLTNNVHGLVFTFPTDPPNTHAHGYGPAYYPVLAWTLLLSAGALVVLMRRCLVPSVRGRAWQPFLILGLISLYSVLYVCGMFNDLPEDVLDLSVVACTFVLAICESVIQAGLIPSNSHFDALFAQTSIPAQIVDRNGRVAYQTTAWPGISPSYFQGESAAGLAAASSTGAAADSAAANGDRTWAVDANTLLHRHPITSGAVLWAQDLTELNAAKRRLSHTQDQLQDLTVVLQAESQTAAERARIDVGNDLFDRIAKELQKPIQNLDDILTRTADEPDDPVRDRNALRTACLAGTYVKRRANLILLEQSNDRIPGEELVLCLRESNESLKACGMPAYLDAQAEGTLRPRTAMVAYDLLHVALQQVGTARIQSLLANIRITEGTVSIKATLDATVPLDENAGAELAPRFQDIPGIDVDAQMSREQDSFFLHLTMRERDDA